MPRRWRAPAGDVAGRPHDGADDGSDHRPHAGADALAVDAAVHRALHAALGLLLALALDAALPGALDGVHDRGSGGALGRVARTCGNDPGRLTELVRSPTHPFGWWTTSHFGPFGSRVV